jgi:hypothetical protein
MPLSPFGYAQDKLRRMGRRGNLKNFDKIQTGHSERSEESQCFRVIKRFFTPLYGVYLERSRRVQNDNGYISAER